MIYKLYALPTEQITQTDRMGTKTVTVPKYSADALSGKSYAATYYNNAASVVIATEENATLESNSDVVVVTSKDDAPGLPSTTLQIGGSVFTL